MNSMNNKYRVLVDYGVYEGMKLQDEDFDSVNEAVQWAIGMNFGRNFKVIQIITWEAN